MTEAGVSDARLRIRLRQRLGVLAEMRGDLVEAQRGWEGELHEAVGAARERGISVQEIAELLGYCNRQAVYRIIERRQMPMLSRSRERVA